MLAIISLTKNQKKNAGILTSLLNSFLGPQPKIGGHSFSCSYLAGVVVDVAKPT